MATRTELMERIDNLGRAYLDLMTNQVDPLRSRINDLRLEVAKLDYPFQKGDLIESASGTRRFFEGFEMCMGSWEPICRKVKNDGTPYAATCRLSWSNIRPGEKHTWRKVDDV